MSYSKLAKHCSIGAAVVSAAFSVTLVATTPLGLAYLPIALVVAIVAGSLAYLTIWLIWNLRSEDLIRKGHRW